MIISQTVVFPEAVPPETPVASSAQQIVHFPLKFKFRERERERKIPMTKG
jgi:hypothetical protein